MTYYMQGDKRWCNLLPIKIRKLRIIKTARCKCSERQNSPQEKNTGHRNILSIYSHMFACFFYRRNMSVRREDIT